MTNAKPPATVDEYLQSFPENVRAILQRARQVIRRAAPDAIETMSYGIPTFDLNGSHLVFIAGWKSHISLYPAPAGDSAYQEAIAPYRKVKSTLRFPLNKSFPYDLVERTVTLLQQEKP